MLLSLLACSNPSVPEPGPTVVVLVIDGVRTDEITSTSVSDLTGVTGEESAPHLWSEVAPEGTVVRALRNTGVTITAPAHAALLVGQDVAYGNFPTQDGPERYRPSLPTLFDEASAAGVKGLLVANTPLLAGLEKSLYPGVNGGEWRYIDALNADDASPINDSAVARRVRDAIDSGARLIVANLHNADAAGHYSPEGAYEAGAAQAEEIAADIWGWLGRTHPELADHLLFAVVADHGRHRTGEDDYWRNHGDACAGCREIPLFLAGAEVEAGTELSGGYRLLDLTPTIAAHLGIDAPWAQGLPLVEAAPDLDATVRSGEIDVATSGGLVATQVWLTDRDERSAVEVDGVTLAGGALGAGGPSVLDGTWRFACLRELVDLGETMPWTPRCFVEEDGWTDVGFPTDEVSPVFRAVLVERRKLVWAAWADNPHQVADHVNPVGLGIASWNEGGWSEKLRVEAEFPTDPALVPTDSGLVAAFGASLGDPDYRYTRRVRAVTFTAKAGVATAGKSTDFELENLLGDERRVELPALSAQADHVALAMVGIDNDTTLIAAVTSEDAGTTWSEPVALPDGGSILVHLAPAWDGDRVVWGVLDGDEARLCRAALGDATAECVDVGSPRLQSFSVQDGVATVIRDGGVAAWERATVTW